MTFAAALLFTYAITECMKKFCGRLRPVFFSRCKYPYNEVNRTYGTVGVLGDYSKCQETDKHILKDVRKSFPSGHSATSTAGMGYLSLYLYTVLVNQFGEEHNYLIFIISSIPYIGALFICGTRTVY